MDIESVKIALRDTDDKVKQIYLIEYDGQCTNRPYDRVITREPNEEGRWKRLIAELEDMAEQYGISFDKALEIFESVSCDKKQFRQVLENKSYTTWASLDDMGLQNSDSPEYKHLLATKGEEEVQRRKKFLGISN